MSEEIKEFIQLNTQVATRPALPTSYLIQFKHELIVI